MPSGLECRYCNISSDGRLNLIHSCSMEDIRSKQQDLFRRKGEVLKIFRETVGSKRIGMSPMKILLVGTPGAGKSSLINTCITSITKDRYIECAAVGPGRQPVTRKIIKYSQDGYCTPSPQSDACLPTFIDMAGLEDEDSDVIKHILQMACAGKLPEGTKITNNPRTTRARADLTIDRIVFVASADQSIPSRLIKSILWASKHCGKLDVPVFGVLSKIDLMKDRSFELQQKIKEMRECLNCSNIRVATLKSYCPDVDPKERFRQEIDPKIDIPVISFLTQVCNPAIIQAVNLEWKGDTQVDTIFQLLNEIIIYFRQLLTKTTNLILYLILFFAKVFLIVLAFFLVFHLFAHIR